MWRVPDGGDHPGVGEINSYDNDLAEAFNGLYKWELIHQQGPWRRSLDDVEFATMDYIDWFNIRRLQGEITDDNTYTTPTEIEQLSYRQSRPSKRRLPKHPSSHETRGGSCLRLGVDGGPTADAAPYCSQ